MTAGLVIQAGVLRPGWCPVCKARTLLCADVLLLTPEGVSTLGAWSWCEVHEDPAAPLPARRTAPYA
ncbi:hypothetical protein [Streptomyces sp. NPDC054771]